MHRDRLAGQHRLVDRAAAFDDRTVDRDLLAGAYAQAVADVDVGERDVLLAAVAQDAPRRPRRERPSRGASSEAASAPSARAGSAPAAARAGRAAAGLAAPAGGATSS